MTSNEKNLNLTSIKDTLEEIIFLKQLKEQIISDTELTVNGLKYDKMQNELDKQEAILIIKAATLLTKEAALKQEENELDKLEIKLLKQEQELLRKGE